MGCARGENRWLRIQVGRQSGRKLEQERTVSPPPESRYEEIHIRAEILGQAVFSSAWRTEPAVTRAAADRGSDRARRSSRRPLPRRRPPPPWDARRGRPARRADRPAGG